MNDGAIQTAIRPVVQRSVHQRFRRRRRPKVYNSQCTSQALNVIHGPEKYRGWIPQVYNKVAWKEDTRLRPRHSGDRLITWRQAPGTIDLAWMVQNVHYYCCSAFSRGIFLWQCLGLLAFVQNTLPSKRVDCEMGKLLLSFFLLSLLHKWNLCFKLNNCFSKRPKIKSHLTPLGYF